MYKKLIIVALVLTAWSITAAAAPSIDNPLKVDLNGHNDAGDPARTQPGWESWDFLRNPATNTFAKQFNGAYGSVNVGLEAVRYDGGLPPTRSRYEAPGDYLSKVYQDLIAVMHSDGVGLGMDYMKLDFDFGTANAGKTFECTLFSWDLVYGYNPDLVDTPPEYIPPLGSKRAAWSLNNPAQWCVDNNYPIGYDTNGMPPELAAAVLDLNPVMGLRAELRGDAYVYSSTFSIVADASGQVTLYGWADMSSWVGNQHLPFNGFTVVPEPITVTLLGLGGLAVLQKRKR